MASVVVLELNEVNFDFVKAYGLRGQLPELNRLIRTHGLGETTSEREYREWEPWIQWVTAHSGKTLAEHDVFRLGDIVDTDVDQIWEQLERQGVSVAAMSPMNASNRLTSPAFFLPDPWTKTAMTGPKDVCRLYAVLAEAVNDNASGRLTPSMIVELIGGLIRYARPSNYLTYFKVMVGSVRGSWRRAIFLDLFLGDLFIHLMKTTKPRFATVFMNAAAHIQHHYMFSSAVYDGGIKNPEWYVAGSQDPILEIYQIYDRQIAAIQKALPGARLMIATGLHQVPHGRETYYWRLRDHRAFLRLMDIPFAEVRPLMSRDFVVECRTEAEALEAESQLRRVVADDGAALFAIDNRGRDLFIELVYPKDIQVGTGWRVGNRQFNDLKAHVAFVAIKNGEHDGVGYFIDTGDSGAPGDRFPLTDLPKKMAAACGVTLAGG